MMKMEGVKQQDQCDVSAAISGNTGARDERKRFDDMDELEAELEELEGVELEEQLLQPATTAAVAPVYVPAGRLPTRPAPRQNTAREDELAALQA
ncbi:hypothetical protein L1987_60112 [Smallanthus sonchifolius]|uniref:Uncharacterized protein n=1 Tax=Smallanthus sonchifolius TaxID=185202 RepID=A0ACB9D7J7_9ASTR|nr:hypothetical protein L1987_60112 [Smallanthus sonchifolius]